MSLWLRMYNIIIHVLKTQLLRSNGLLSACSLSNLRGRRGGGQLLFSNTTGKSIHILIKRVPNVSNYHFVAIATLSACAQ